MKFTIKQIVAATRGELVAEGRTEFHGVNTDSRKVVGGELFVPLRGDNFDGHDYIRVALGAGAGGFIFEKAAMRKNAAIMLADRYGVCAVAVKDALYALGELARYARDRFPKLPVVAITGSSGKSTTKEMVAAILSRSMKILKNEGNLNNRVGLPITLFKLTDNVAAAVVELGTNEPGEIARLAEIARPQVACVTNVGPVHLEGLGSIEGVAKEKGELPAALTRKDTFVANVDDPHALGMAKTTDAKIVAYGLSNWEGEMRKAISPASRLKEFVTAREIESNLAGSNFILITKVGETEIKLPVAGHHNVHNAVAAAAIARAMGSSLEDIAAGLKGFKSLPLRTQIHKLEGDIVVIEDCYNSNPVSVSAALELLTRDAGRTLAVLGEMRELGDSAISAHERMGDLAAMKGVNVLIAIGDHAKNIVKGFRRQNKTADAMVVRTVQEAAERVNELLKPGDRVLLKASRAVRLEDAYPIIEQSLQLKHGKKSLARVRKTSRSGKGGR